MVYQAEDRAKVRRQQTELAIQLAMQGRWEDAVKVNRTLISVFPSDVDAYNRLGKALTELGRYGEARDAYSKALELDPHNAIARKNLTRLAALGEEAAPRRSAQKLSPQMFIEEMGKTGVTTLVRPNLEVAARMTAGDQVFLVRENGTVRIESSQGEYVGEIEPKLAQRLVKLIEAGNEYVAAITGLSDSGDVKVFIRETFQHPSQAGKLSFPPTVTETFRPYVKERLVRQDAEDEDFGYGEEGEDWEQTGEPTADVTIYQINPGGADTEAEDVAAEEEE
ncbi:MAG: tetratricopeptide repeat protein [Chloroflexi bacterium]|nr:tetratricopeptide repeat protein [Chloroflexota bacterium]